MKPGPEKVEAYRKANEYLSINVPAVPIASSRYVFLKKPTSMGWRPPR